MTRGMRMLSSADLREYLTVPRKKHKGDNADKSASGLSDAPFGFNM